jgi:hypothetical protein
VGGVGDEVPLGLEGGFEPREEVVEGVPEFLQLKYVAALLASLRQASAQAFSKRFSGRGHVRGRSPL